MKFEQEFEFEVCAIEGGRFRAKPNSISGHAFGSDVPSTICHLLPPFTSTPMRLDFALPH